MRVGRIEQKTGNDQYYMLIPTEILKDTEYFSMFWRDHATIILVRSGNKEPSDAHIKLHNAKSLSGDWPVHRVSGNATKRMYLPISMGRIWYTKEIEFNERGGHIYVMVKS